MDRKDEHIQYAKASTPKLNSFDEIHLNHYSLPYYNIEEIDFSTSIGGIHLNCPFFINAMTGGSKKALTINKRLAYVAHKCDLMIATGSYSAAIKNPIQKESFTIIKSLYPNLITATNMGSDKPLSYIQQAIFETNANFAQIHLNTLQELLMPEGDHNFSSWKTNIEDILSTIKIPVIIKEVGFGMSVESIQYLINLGAKIIDISGKGGTNFAYIENKRSASPAHFLDDWGISTVNSLLNTQTFQHQCEFIASGGIRNALDIVKSLVLGAKAVGISQLVLNLIENHSDEEVILFIETLKINIKKIMCLLNAKTISELKEVQYYITGDTLQYYNQITNKN